MENRQLPYVKVLSAVVMTQAMDSNVNQQGHCPDAQTTGIYSLDYCAQHKDYSIHIETENMHCQGTAFARALDMGLTSADGKNLDCFE